jgi:molybdopterin synthase catalytic subunit
MGPHASAVVVRIQHETFDEALEAQRLRHAQSGARVSFVGYVRDGDNPSLNLKSLTLEHYPGMTESAIENMVNVAWERFSLQQVTIIHRIGELHVGDPIVWVMVTSRHRRDAFEGCEFLMDYLKTQAPFWKKEAWSDGTSQWVDARESDDEALRRWGVASHNATQSEA